MSHPVWPVGLPANPRTGDWKMNPKLAPIATEFEQGNLRQRARPGDNIRVIEQKLRWTKAQYAVWESFYLANGTGRITMPVYLGGSALVDRTVQIVGVSETQYEGIKFIVPMKLRVYGA